MPDEQTEPFAAVGVSLTRNDRIVGNLADPDLAEWVAEACNTLTEMEAAQAEWEASGEAPCCSVVEVDGEPIRVNARLETDEDRAAMGEVIRAAKRRMAEEIPQDRAKLDAEVPLQHGGGNAEDCPICSVRRDLVYPFLCIAHDEAHEAFAEHFKDAATWTEDGSGHNPGESP